MSGRSRLIAIAVLTAGLVGALALFGTGTGTGPSTATPTTFPDLEIEDPIIPDSPLRRRGTPVRPATALPVTDGLPVLDGQLAIISPSKDAHELAVRDVDGEVVHTPLPAEAFGFDVDASGLTVSYRLRADRSSQLYVVPLYADAAQRSLLAGSVVDYAWSSDQPNRLALLTPDPSDAERLVIAGATANNAVGYADILGTAPSDARIFGLNSSGLWVGFESPEQRGLSVVSFVPLPLEDEQRRSYQRVADLAIVPPTGSTALLADLDLTIWEWLFGLDDGGRMHPLAWAPGDVGSTGRFAAFSPDGTRIAFIGPQPEPNRSWLEVWPLEGGDARRVEIPVAGAEVTWSPTGRFLVVPGTSEGGRPGVALVDLTADTVHLMDHPSPIRVARVIP